MKHLVLAASMLCMSLFSFSQDGEKCKEYPRLKKETSKISRDKADQEFKKNLEMDIDDELRTEKSEQDQIGYTHDKFQQYYKKVKVEGAVYSAHSKNNMIESYSGEYKGIKNFDVKPTISASQGLSAAMNHVDADNKTVLDFIDEERTKSVGTPRYATLNRYFNIFRTNGAKFKREI